MSTITDAVTACVAPLIEAPFELVDVTYEKMGKDQLLSIFIDRPGGITVNETADLTDIISPALDTISPDPFPEQGYLLEVSSPGLERPLKTKEALQGALGQYIHVKLYQAIDKQKEFQGTLEAFDGQELVLTYKDKTRDKTVTIPYQSVAKARLAVKI
ncbi:ribosome maturation factor RimP [Streptococcus sp. DD12]|uniref:ribosome maturation factor RimP n=1 Tax=Streptococcus sp. DD12 TaxID=1777880 RepID=UPI000791D9EB|nr:ribosome maturation factor RimP [Streptococcus sp. DD12]KXT75853.1 hypothetical protein STRDD12_00965 [Streptococcus sp. DD12]